MNAAFANASSVEARSFAILTPFLQMVAKAVAFTGHERCNAVVQERVGDLLVNNHDGTSWTIECKAEERFTGNLFLETWSNKNFANATNYHAVGFKIGWLYTSRASKLLYHFLDADKLYLIDMFALRQWAFGHDSDGMLVEGNVYHHRETAQRRYAQRNLTCGRIVPIANLERQLIVPVQTYRPQQELRETAAARAVAA